MLIDIVTIFPELLEVPLRTSMLGIAQDKGLLRVCTHDLRRWAPGRHRQVDDEPYGGGAGMVMKPEPFFGAVRELRAGFEGPSTVVLLTPQGRLLDQTLVEELAAVPHMVLLCGRYEGFDERVRGLADLQVSIGDYVLTGGELPALVLTDAVSRLIPGVLGDDGSASEDSHSMGLLEYPQYTRPASFEALDVPPVLLSGHHGEVDRWRRLEAIRRTALSRPDLLGGADLTAEERAFAEGVIVEAEERG